MLPLLRQIDQSGATLNQIAAWDGTYWSPVTPSSIGIGSVTSVGLSLPAEFTVSGSPVTTSGTLTGAWASQTQNKVFASPNGSTGAPSFRALVAADIPALSYVTSVGLSLPAEFTVSGSPVTSSGTLTGAWASQTQNKVFASPNGSTGTPSFRALVASDIPALSYVTSVALSLPAEFTVSGSPVTSSGTLTGAWASQTQNKVFASPNGSTGTPGFRALVAADIPALSYVTSVALSLPAEFTVSGSPVTSSGTLTGAWASQTQNKVFASPNGSTGTPSFRALVASDIPALSYVTSVAMTVPSFLSVSGSPITSSGTLAVTLATQSANLVFAGPSSGAAAAPTFRSLVPLDWAGSSAAGSIAFASSTTVLAWTAAADLVWDNTNKRLGIGVASPARPLDVAATQGASSGVTFTGSAVVITASGADTTGTRIGLTSTVNATHTSSSILVLYAAQGIINGSGNGGTTANARAWFSRVDSQTGHTVTAGVGLYIANGTGSGTITTQYGIFIESLTKGGTNWAIFAQGGQSSHAGSFRFGSNTAPTYTVDATGDINASGVYRVGGTGGATGTVTYLKNLGGATGTITISGGIITAFT